MSQGQTAPAPPPAAQPQTAPPPAGQQPQGGAQIAPKAHAENTPKLLNRWQVIAVTACLLFGVASAVLQLLSNQANGRAADNTEQLVRVQQIQTDLLHADAVASNAFLVGGIEPADQRAEYDATIKSVLNNIASAAEAQSADRKALAALNVEVSSYTTGIAQARDNNRQGFPVGAQYLSAASQDLRTNAKPILDNLVTANSERADDEMGGQHPVWLFVIGLAAIGVLYWVNREMAKRFRRRFNVGLAAAAIGIAAVTVLACFQASGRSGSNSDLQDGAYKEAVNTASARTEANSAKGSESLRLIQRGSGDANEIPWQDAADKVTELTTDTGLRARFNAYAEVHAQLVDLDNKGDWDGAVKVATAADGTTPVFAAYDEAAANVVKDRADTSTSELRSGSGIAWVLTTLTLLVGLIAAAVATWGINQRRREYS